MLCEAASSYLPGLPDLGWHERVRVCASLVGTAPTEPLETLHLDRQNVATVFGEFVQSDFARSLFISSDIMCVTDYGEIHGMFESVQLVGTNLELKLKQVRSSRLVD